ncbi:META domain-containing protein [Acidimicrobiia bacterium EGI L10123]|uniref:META domain-containing protein n=1 Tax=Salinilacustrithrix flava TaxID=2957203 RepID=UPI003D7C2F83|nr:META domain-containing protein [Acidimicrobiia bacterium EGI L10123]
MRYALALLALIVVATVSACGDDDASVGTGGGTADLAAEYLSIEVTEAGAPRPLVEGTVISLRFDDGRVGASLGCNQLGGPYELDGDRLLVEDLSMTEMGCDPERHAQDEWFAGVLQAEPTVVVEGDTMALTAGETVVRFVDREVAEPDRELVGTTWEVDGFADGQDPDDAAMSMAVDQPGIVRFEEGGFVTGSDGCNGFGFSTIEGEGTDGLRYEVDGEEVVFTGAVVSELQACPELEEYTDRFWAVLTGTATWSVDADQLTLVGEDGRVVTFRATD